MNLKINPCKACHEIYGNDINNMNNCVYGVAGAYLGQNNVNDVLNSPYGQHCQECMNNVFLSNGKTLCEFRLQPPVLFNDSPHYFPQLLFKNNSNVNTTYLDCINKCGVNWDCKKNCLVDAKALEIEKNINNKSNLSLGYKSEDNSESKNMSKIYFIVVIVVVTLLIYIF